MTEPIRIHYILMKQTGLSFYENLKYISWLTDINNSRNSKCSFGCIRRTNGKFQYSKLLAWVYRKNNAKQKRIRLQKHKFTNSVNTIPHVENYSNNDKGRPGQNVTQEMNLCYLCLFGHIPGETKEYRGEHQSDLFRCCIHSNLNFPGCVHKTLPSESNCSDVDCT